MRHRYPRQRTPTATGAALALHAYLEKLAAAWTYAEAADLRVLDGLVSALERQVARGAGALPAGSRALVAIIRASVESAADAAGEPRMHHLEAAARAVESLTERMDAESAFSVAGSSAGDR